MLGVKLTVLLIVITIIAKVVVESLFANESAAVRLNAAINNNYPKYVYVFVVLVLIDFIGIIYSVIWFLFLR